jgi:hypothetical protein
VNGNDQGYGYGTGAGAGVGVDGFGEYGVGGGGGGGGGAGNEPDAGGLDDGFWDAYEDEEDDPSRFVNYSLLSHISVQLRDKVPRGSHVKGGIPYEGAFTGKDVVVSTSHL